MKKPYKVLSATALAAVLATSSLVPVIAQAAPANQIKDVIVSKDGVNYKMKQSQYDSLVDAGKVPGTVAFITSSTGKTYTINQFNNAIDSSANVDEALTKLDTTATAQNPTTVDATFDSNGNLVTTPVAGELKVESVSAINAKEVKVTFNNPVDAATAINEANYEFVVDTNILTRSTDLVGTSGKKGTLSADGKSVTFQLTTALTNASKYAIHVKDGVLDKNLNKVEKYTDTAKTFTDSQAPQVLEAKVIDGTAGNKRIKLTFSEPINASAAGFAAKVDGTTVALNAGSNYPSTGTYTLETADIVDSDDIFKKGDHTVVVYNATDLITPNSNVASSQTVKYTVSADVTAPTVKSVDPINSRSFRVVFSEPLSVAPTVTVKKGNYTFATGTSDGKVQTVKDTASGIPNAYVVSITEETTTPIQNPLWNENESSVALSVKLEGYKDNANLLGETVTKSVTLAKDTKTPTVPNKALNTVTANDLVIQFDGKLDAAAVDASKIVVRNKDGVVVTTSATMATVDGTDASKLNIYKAAAGGNFSPAYDSSQEPYTVEFKAGAVKYAKDTTAASYSVNTNKNTAFSTTVSETSTSFPLKVKTNAIITTTTVGLNGELIVDYGEDMDANAKSLSNYTIDGNTLPAGTEIDFIEGTQKVRITLPEGSFSKTQNALFTVSTNVKTKAGERIVVNAQTKKPVENIIQFTDNKEPELTSAKYLLINNADDTSSKVQLTFSESMATVTNNTNFQNDFKVLVNGVKQTVSTVANGSDDKDIVLTFANAVNVNQAATITIVPEADQNDGTPGNNVIAVKDKAGNKAKENSSVTTSGNVIDTDAIAQNAADKATAQAAADAAVQALSYNGTDSTVTLPSGVDSWTSSDAATINDAGTTVVRPAYGTPDKTVTFTASKTVNGQTATATKILTVKAHTVDATASTKTNGASNITTASGNTTFTVTLKDTAGTAITGKTLSDFGLTSDAVSSKLNITGGTESPAGTYTFTATTTGTSSTDNATENFTVIVDGVTLTAKPAVTIAIP